MAKKVKKWFSPGKSTGWSKEQKPTTRRAKLLASTDKRMSMYHRYISAGRKILALSNVTTDDKTKDKAKIDANYFFRKAKNKGE